MLLYYSPGSCALSPHIVLLEAGYRFELKRVDLHRKLLEDGSDYWKVNPKGSVPTLELDDGRRMSEGPAIVQYLADGKPDSGLAPPNGVFERYRLQEWLNFISAELHKSYSPLFNKDLPSDQRAALVERIGKSLSFTAAQLESKSFLLGDHFTVADAYLFAVLRWSRGFQIDLYRWPALVDFLARVAARPKVREAMAQEGIGL